MTKLLITTLFILVTAFFSIFHQVSAQQTATPSGDLEAAGNLRERLKIALVDDKPSGQGPTAYVGVVRDVIKSTIVVEDKDSKKNVMVEEGAEIIRSPGGSSIQIDQIQIEDHIIAMGYPQDGELLGRRLIVSANPFNPPEKLSGLGTITQIGRYSFTLQTDTQDDFELFFTKSTQYKSPAGALELADLSIGDQLLFTAVKDADDDWSATQVMRVRQTLSTPSPSPQI